MYDFSLPNVLFFFATNNTANANATKGHALWKTDVALQPHHLASWVTLL